MKKVVSILLLEDNMYFNSLLLQELRNYVNSYRFKTQFRFMFHTFTNACDLIMGLRSPDFENTYSIAFIDYNLGSGIIGKHIVKMLREKSAETSIVILSESKRVKKEIITLGYDYFVPKDNSAAALCRLCLEQFLENKYL